MSKRSEEAALKAYPKEDGKVWTSPFGKIEFDRNATGRKGFQEGYEQAEKDYTKLKELADNMYSAAQYLTTDASRLRKAMEEYYNYIVYKVKL